MRMEKITGRLSNTVFLRILRSRHMPFITLWAIMAVCHLLFKLGTGDDVNYAQLLNERTLLEQLVYSYYNWSARTLVDIGLVVMNYLPGLVWRLANPVMVVLCAHALACIAGVRHNTQTCWYICGTMLLYPWQVMSSAGWITTTTAFLWPAAAALLALIPTAQIFRGQKVGAIPAALSLVALLYAACMEQVAAICLALLLGCFVYQFIKKRPFSWLLLAQIVVVALVVVWIATSPGTQARYEAERASWYPTLEMKPFISKLELGFSLALSNLFYSRNFIFAFFCLLLSWLVWRQYKDVLYRVVSLVPLAVCLFFGMFQQWTIKLFPGIAFFTESLQAEGIISLANANTLTAYLPMLLLYGSFVLCLGNIYLVVGHRVEALVAVYCVCVGVASNAMLGFSPTVHVSGPRTAFFLMLVLVGASGYFYRKVADVKGWDKRVFLVVFAAYCVLQIYSLQEMRIATGY